MKFVVEPSVFETLKDVCFAVVSASGIDNTRLVPEIDALLQQNVAACEAYFENTPVKQSEDIRPYREAFQAMAINPNKYMCSIEALLTRISKKKGMPSINAVVDLGNAVSLKYRVPIGAHDLDSSAEDFSVRVTRTGDTFIPFGETETEIPDTGEIVYAAGHTIRTRRWIWRQSELGKITADTKSVLFPIDGFAFANKDQMIAARDELAALLQKYFGCSVKTGWIDAQNNSFAV